MTTPHSSENPIYPVRVTFTVDADTSTEAADTVAEFLRSTTDPDTDTLATSELRSRVAGWDVERTSSMPGWESLEGTGTPEIVAEMFPPEPDPNDFRTPSGALDQDAFEDAHEPWREECLLLAVNAARLPELLARLEQAERVRDSIVDALERHPIPERPAHPHLAASLFGFTVDEEAVEAEQQQWKTHVVEAATARDQALRGALKDGGGRTAYLPARFQQEWIPRDLIAVTALRSLLDADPAVTGRILDRDTRQHLDSMLHADDPDVHVADPDDPDGVELYEGVASEAHRWIPPGVYDATSPEREGEFRVVIGRAPMSGEGTASWAFPTTEHDSRLLSEIARTLETYRASEDGMSTEELLDRVNDLVAQSGRTSPGEPTTRLEQGVMLSDLLAERDRELDHPDTAPDERPGSERRPGPEDPGLTR